MSWVSIDDQLPDNLKIAALSDRAFRAYITSICYCGRNLTDGAIPGRHAKQWAGKTLGELVPNLWEPREGGYNVHDYLKYNPTRKTVLARRARDSTRKRGGIHPGIREESEPYAPGNPLAPLPPPSPPPVRDEEKSLRTKEGSSYYDLSVNGSPQISASPDGEPVPRAELRGRSKAVTEEGEREFWEKEQTLNPNMQRRT